MFLHARNFMKKNEIEEHYIKTFYILDLGLFDNVNTIVKIEFQILNSRFSIFAVYRTWKICLD